MAPYLIGEVHYMVFSPGWPRSPSKWEIQSHQFSGTSGTHTRVKTFLKGQTDKRVLLLSDNSIVVTYCTLTNCGEHLHYHPEQAFWLDNCECGVLTGVLCWQLSISQARRMCWSRYKVENDEGELWLAVEPINFQHILALFPHLNVDLLAWRLPSFPSSCSWKLDPLARQQMPSFRTGQAGLGMRNPPWNLIGRVLAKVEEQKVNVHVILVAPVWPSRPWYPRLLSLLVEIPYRITPPVNLLQEMWGGLPELQSQLAVWPTTGNIHIRPVVFKLQVQVHTKCRIGKWLWCMFGPITHQY